MCNNRSVISNPSLQKIIDEYIIELLAKDPVLNKMLGDICTYDNATFLHSVNVCRIAHQISVTLHMSKEDVKKVTIGALVHDIGKLEIPNEILNKQDELSEEEWELVKKHPEEGYNRCIKNGIPEEIARFVLEHHERLDGTGYPKGMTADQILYGSKIIMLADVYDAMCSQRPYKGKYPPKFVQKTIEGQKKTVYDEQAVNALFEILSTKGD